MATKKRLIIYADDLIKCLKKHDRRIPGIPWSITGIQNILKELKPVDAVEVVHSQFKKSNEEIENYRHCYSCIECGATMMVEDTNFHDTAPNWCALCGAKMDGDGNGT